MMSEDVTPSDPIGRHPGEVEAHAVSGEGGHSTGSGRVNGIVSDKWKPFLESQRIVYLSGSSDDGEVWCTAVARAKDAVFDIIEPSIARFPFDTDSTDPLCRNFKNGDEIGALVVDFDSARRLRFNGVAHQNRETLEIHCHQAFRNCKKYIHRISFAQRYRREPQGMTSGKTLDSYARDIIESASFFFLATRSRKGDMDISYRGGPRGFVQADGTCLRWPDLRGNSYYMSIGNIISHPISSLLFIDIESGDMLHVYGTAEISWEQADDNSGRRAILFRPYRYEMRKQAFPLAGEITEYGTNILDDSSYNHNLSRKADQ